MMWSGLFTAIVTPFTPNSENVDIKTFAGLIEKQVQAGTDGIVVLGTTGESPTIDPDEAELLLKTALDVAAGRTKIIAGISGNNTKKVLQDVQSAAALDVDGIMVAAPYYNKPTQAGIAAHYGAIAETTRLPVMVYNIPGRTGINIALDTLLSLHQRYPHISAVKEASGDYQQIADTVRAFRGTNFHVLSGDDSMVLPVIALGGHGVVSVLSNLYPQVMKQLVTALAQGDVEQGRRLYDQYLPLMRGIFIGGNPGGIKTLMAQEKLLSLSLRLPLCPPSDDETAQLLSVYKEASAKTNANRVAA